MTKLVKIMRQEIFECDSFRFSGTFPPKCQEISVPTVLKNFLSMLLNGPHVRNQDDLKLVLQFLNLCALMSNRKDLLLKAVDISKTEKLHFLSI